MLQCEQIETASDPDACIIWLHGLGADGNDFVPIVPELGLSDNLSIRFIFPHAPMIPVRINQNMIMRAWHNIDDFDFATEQDRPGILNSQQQIIALIEQQLAMGIQHHRMLLAGFSQGGAIALQTALGCNVKLAGIIALSTYLPLHDSLEQAASEINRSTPVFMGHGQYDTTVPFQVGLNSRDRLLQKQYSVEWHEYPMDHAVCGEEITHIGNWINQRLT